MDDDNGNKPRGGKNAAPATEATQQPAPPPVVLLCDGDDVLVASVDETCGGGGADDEEEEDDNDDEQVERFYALLANIRAMRGRLPLAASSSSTACGGGSGDTGTDNADAGECTARKKRLRRSAEPPWRPAFRMEDFEEPPPTPRAASTASCKLRKLTSGAGHDEDHNGHGESSGGSARPRQSPSSTSMPLRFQQSADDSKRAAASRD